MSSGGECVRNQVTRMQLPVYRFEGLIKFFSDQNFYFYTWSTIDKRDLHLIIFWCGG